ncbi:hypothetical protein HID58_050824 [Brassica napus]|uniref:LUC7 related protein n=1 Tax=Brassica napus TaxID=3708 RepID=A0ABQ8A796_BRANA|nr:hypothetical protein HID58_050824 [Brassica napus]
MDAMRKQLDVLMGANRNGDVTEVNRKYYDRDVCRLYLSGLCPHDLFQLTKMDMSPCPKVHSLQLRKEYLFFLSLELYFSVFVALTHSLDIKKRRQKVLEDAIDKAQGTHLVALDRHAPFKTQVECDRKIGRALKRLQEENAKAAIAISVTQVAQSPEIQEADLHVEEMRTKRADLQAVLLLEAFNKDRAALPTPAQQPSAALPPPNPRTQEMINEKLKKAEEFGELGMVDEAQKALEEAEALKKTDQKLRLCDICGAFLSIYDSDRRLADHFGGKLHLGYMLIRDKLAELQCRLCSYPLSVFCRRKRTKFTRNGWKKGDQRRGAESENQVKRETEEIAVTVVEILTVGIEIATGIMSMTETIISHAGMTREAGAVRVPGRGKDQEIMIAAAIKTAGDSCSKFKKFLETRLESI